MESWVDLVDKWVDDDSAKQLRVEFLFAGFDGRDKTGGVVVLEEGEWQFRIFKDNFVPIY